MTSARSLVVRPPPGPSGAAIPPDCLSRRPVGSRIKLESLEELDDVFAFADSFAGVDEARRWQVVRSVFLGIRTAPEDSEPSSDSYRRWNEHLYETIARKPYSVDNESTEIFVSEAVRDPYPYNTGDPLVVAKSFEESAAILRVVAAKQASAILECGPGWGNNTLPLVRSGYDVTVLDIERRFLKLIKHRLKDSGKRAHFVNGDFLDIGKLKASSFDVVLFHNCFHHSSQHRDVVRAVASVLRPGGRALFAFEPISDDFPVPWGLRFDGESLYQIRRNGWLELGFKKDYFVRLLSDFGLDLTNEIGPAGSETSILEFTRSHLHSD